MAHARRFLAEAGESTLSMDVVKALAKIRQGDVAPAYVLWGSRAFQDRVVEALRRKVVDAAWDELNYSRLDGREAGAAAVTALARSAPFGAGGRLVVVTNPPFLRKGDDSAIQGYLRSPAASSVVAFLLDDKPPQSGAVRLIDETGGVVDCSGRGSAVVEWVRARVKEGGKGITPEALWAVCELSSGDPDFLDTEIDKLVTYAGDDPSVTIAHVNEAGFGHSVARVFDLVDRIMEGDASKSLGIVAHLALAGEDLQRIAQVMAWRLRTLYRFKHLVDHGASPRDAGREAGVKDFLLGRLSREAARLAPGRIASALEAILDTDVAVKSGLLNDKDALDVLVVRLCGLLGPGGRPAPGLTSARPRRTHQ